MAPRYTDVAASNGQRRPRPTSGAVLACRAVTADLLDPASVGARPWRTIWFSPRRTMPLLLLSVLTSSRTGIREASRNRLRVRSTDS
jgi:hypothetical protein